MMIDKDFLKNFDQRMKCVGRYSVLCSNSFDKKLWKEYGIETRDEQMNMLFTLLLFIMEYSLREENCTMDEIASFVEDISYGYYGRKLNFEKSQEFARPLIMKNGPIRTSISAILIIRSYIWRMESGEPPII